MSGKVEIVHAPTKAEPFVVAFKPRNLPTAPLKEGDDCAFFQIAALFPEVLGVCGRKKIEGGLFHRLDNETSGLFVCATSQDFFDALTKEQENGGFVKTYRAKVDFVPDCASVLGGFPPKPKIVLNDFSVSSRFRAFGEKGRAVRPVTDLSKKAALKNCGKTEYKTDIFLQGETAECKIKSGFRHQVRCHLAWCGFPIKGDALYNPVAKGELQFCAVRLDFSGFSFEAAEDFAQ